MKMKRTNYHYPERMLQRLKKAKKKTGLPVIEIIRRAVNGYLDRLERREERP